MMKSSLFFLLMIGGSFALLVDICDFKKCHSLARQLNLFNPDNVLPTKERLSTLCPSIMEVMECERQEWNICLDEDIDSYLTSENETLAAMANVYVGVSGLFLDLCDDTTPLYKAYAENIVCIKDVAMSSLTQSMCASEVTAFATAYRRQSPGMTMEKNACMVTAHIFACISGEIFKDCGEEARATAVQFVKRTKLLKYGVCKVEDLEELKTTYLDFLEQESQRRNIFARAFDLRKK